MRVTIYAGLLLLLATEASAAPRLRAEVEQPGNFALIGNTLGHDCREGSAEPIVGSVGSCGASTSDSSPDVFWRDAIADSGHLVSDARSSAVLSLPSGAKVTHAFLYWAARRSGSAADTSVTVECSGELSHVVSATESFVVPAGPDEVHYQSVADVSELVQAAGSGAYRVSGVDSLSLSDLDEQVVFSGWYLVVFYELGSDRARRLALFDGLDLVEAESRKSFELAGLFAPDDTLEAKLGVVAFEGDFDMRGDTLRFAGVSLSDAANPADNFFNGSRSWHGTPVGATGDLPELSGTPGSVSGLDLDVIDVSAQLDAVRDAAEVEVESAGDVVLLGAFVTSVATRSASLALHADESSDFNGEMLQGGGCACAAGGEREPHELWFGLSAALAVVLSRRRFRPG